MDNDTNWYRVDCYSPLNCSTIVNHFPFLIMFGSSRRFRGVINEDGYRYDVEVSAPTLHAAYDIVQRREGVKRSQIVYVQEV